MTTTNPEQVRPRAICDRCQRPATPGNPVFTYPGAPADPENGPSANEIPVSVCLACERAIAAEDAEPPEPPEPPCPCGREDEHFDCDYTRWAEEQEGDDPILVDDGEEELTFYAYARKVNRRAADQPHFVKEA